jgi:hypothetical protein
MVSQKEGFGFGTAGRSGLSALTAVNGMKFDRLLAAEGNVFAVRSSLDR